MTLSLVVAMADNRVIGVNNRIPWSISADLRRFRHLTMGKPILMGRRTHESIGRPLPGRKNIVLTSDSSYRAAGCTVVHSTAEALREAGDGEAFVIGGTALYREFLPIADRIYLTEVHENFAGDTYFPEFDRKQWREMERIELKDEATELPFTFLTLERLS